MHICFMIDSRVIFDTSRSTLDRIDSAILRERDIQLFVKRDDLIHSEVSGNKWRKLKFNIEECIVSKYSTILTFGGAYSNHLLATASAAKELKLQSIGVVRGEELTFNSNQTLNDCYSLGMDLVFISREQYKERYESQFHEELKLKFPSTYIVPEGGANYQGVMGCLELYNELPIDIDEIFVAQGTTTTSCGLMLGLRNQQKLNVVPALKGFDSIFEMKSLMQYSGIDQEFIDEQLMNVNVLDQYHFGGYGKYNDELLDFMKKIENEYKIPLDQVYTAKCMYALFDQIKKGLLDNKKVVFIHTGGVQGTRSILK